jgi:carbon monoxide dehydrogenase subunit G
LNNIDVLNACIPGCEPFAQTAPYQYEVLIKAVVGPVNAKFMDTPGLADWTPGVLHHPF